MSDGHIICVTLIVHIPAAQSLKDKRRYIKSLKDKIHARFNASIAEIDALDEWRRSVLGVVMISNDRAYLEQQLNALQTLVLQQHEIQLADVKLEWL